MADEIEEKVKKIIIEQLEVAPDKVKLEASFSDDLKADSLAVVELVLALEEQFKIEIPDEDTEKIKTVGDAINYIKGTRNRRGRTEERTRMARRVVVTGIGLVTPIAVGTEETWQGLLAGKSGIGPITHFDHSTFATHFAGEVKNFDLTRWMTSREAKTIDLFIQYGVAAGLLAVADSGLEIKGEFAERVGCFVGAGLGGVTHHRGHLQDAVGEGPAPRHLAVLRPDDHRQPGARADLDPDRRQGAEHVAGVGVLDRRARDRRRGARHRARRRRRDDLRRHRGDRVAAGRGRVQQHARAVDAQRGAPAGVAAVRQRSRRLRDRRGRGRRRARGARARQDSAARRSTPRCAATR